MRKDIDVVDIFDEEVNKKEKKISRRVERARLKEEKSKEKKEKKLEKKEDHEFSKYLKKLKSENKIGKAIKISEKDDELAPKPHKTIKDNIEEELTPKPVKTKTDFFDHINVNSVEKTLSRDIIPDKKPEKKHPILNIIIAFLAIILLVISIDYVVYNTIQNFKDIKTAISSILILTMTIFYLLSIITKKEALKKWLQILSLISIILFMSYNLFII